MFDKTVSRCRNSQQSNLHRTVTEKFQKYADFKEELIRMWQFKTTHTVPPVLSTAVLSTAVLSTAALSTAALSTAVLSQTDYR